MSRIAKLDDLRVFRQAYEAALELHRRSETWPREERYALTDQLRRSSRSVCANLAEAWCKRRYPRAFVSKLNDAEGEAAETQVWLRFARDFGYLPPAEEADVTARYDTILGGLTNMIRSVEQWQPGTAHEPDAFYNIE
jgi:four helix bundle protein